MIRVLRLSLAALLLFGGAGSAAAQSGGDGGGDTESFDSALPPGQTGLPLPRFASLRAPEVNLRTGPGIRYPIEWVYTRRGMPLQIVGEFETWRRIRDWQGTEGWVHQSMLSGQRSALVVGRQRPLRRAPEADAPPLALVQAGVVGAIDACEQGWCRIEVDGFAGWLREDELYGVLPGESVD
jgi:SH3-like domain-containing protein